MNLNEVNFINNFRIKKKLSIFKYRFPKIIEFNEELYLFGSKIEKSDNNINKYLINFVKLSNDFNIISETEKKIDFNNLINEYFNDLNISSWLRNIYVYNNYVYMLVEIKKNLNNIYFEIKNFLIKTNDFNNYIIVKNIEIDTYVFNNYNNIYFSSKKYFLEEFIWGKYLFNFNINGLELTPNFDNYVDFNDDHGHIVHNILFDKIKKENLIIFSIRKKKHNTNVNSFIYENYFAYTNDFINYIDTTKILFNLDYKDEKIDTNFLTYPNFFIYKNKNYIITNQDDFGKEKNLLLFEQY